MGEELKRRSLADTLRATSPIAGAALASAASAMRRISAPQETTPEAAPAGSHALPEKPHGKGKPVLRPLIRPVSQPLSQSQDHSASLSANLSSDQSQDQSTGPSVSQSRVADRLTPNQRAVLRYLIETRPYIIRFAQLGQAVGLGEATTRTILRRLADLKFIEFSRARDGQIQGVSISFKASLCEQFTQGQSLSQSLDQPVTKPLTSKKRDLDLEEEIHPSEAVAGKLAKLTDEQIASNWPNFAALGFRAIDLKCILKNLSALGISAASLVEGLTHGDFELYAHRKGQPVIRKANGEIVRDPYAYVLSSLRNKGYYARPKGYVSPAEQREMDAEEEARRIVEARKKREEAEFQVWLGRLAPVDRKAILDKGPPGPAEQTLKNAWRKLAEQQNKCRQ